MSTVIEPNAPEGSPAPVNVTGARSARNYETIGLNAGRVISKRYSVKDSHGEPIEEWPDVVRRVVGHVSLAETDTGKRDEFYDVLSGIMRVDHPDLLRFIHAKNDQHSLTNFNISVTVTDKFFEAVDRGEWFQLSFDGEPWTDEVYDPVQDGAYAIYRRADGSTITFRDRAAFETTDLSGATREEPPRAS